VLKGHRGRYRVSAASGASWLAFLSPLPPRLTIGPIAKTSRSVAAQTRADAFARLFEAVHEGVFIGALAPSDVDAADGTTLRVNAATTGGKPVPREGPLRPNPASISGAP